MGYGDRSKLMNLPYDWGNRHQPGAKVWLIARSGRFSTVQECFFSLGELTQPIIFWKSIYLFIDEYIYLLYIYIFKQKLFTIYPSLLVSALLVSPSTFSGVRPERGVRVEAVASWSLSVQCNEVEPWNRYQTWVKLMVGTIYNTDRYTLWI